MRAQTGVWMISAAQLCSVLDLPVPTGEQAAVIEAPLAPALVVAGAGSGKTETMAARVLYLVANELVRPEQILGLTFTRKAAAGLGSRIRRRLRALAASGLLRAEAAAALGAEPEVWTYHAFGGRIIGEFGPLAGVEPGARVLTRTGSWQLARSVVARWDGDLATDLGPELVTERLLAIAGALADHLTDPAALVGVIDDLLHRLRSAPPSPRQKGALHSGLVDHLRRLQDRAWIVPLVEAFIAAKRRAGVIDFADQMQIAADLVLGRPAVGRILRGRHRVVLLDEYQDTGHAQRVILRALFGRSDVAERPSGHPVTAVGDPVQSIYSWRGAAAANLPRFMDDFPRRNRSPAAMLTLSTSFRNPGAVLAVANHISADIRRRPVEVPELRARPGAPVGDLHYGLFETAAAEESWVAASISDIWAAAQQREEPPPSTAVLMRRRRDMDAMAMALRDCGLPVEVVGLGGLLHEPEVADLFALLRVLVDPAAGAAALRLLTGARWQIGPADLEALSRRSQELAGRPPRLSAEASDPDRASVRDALDQATRNEEVDSASLVDAIADPGPPTGYSPEGFRRITRFAAELHRLRSRLSLALPDLLADMERTSGVDVEVAISSPAGRAHLDAFADVVADVAAAGAGPAELVEYLMTADEREDGLAPGEVAPAPGRIQILTVHAAKGLEWEVVAVPQLTDSVFPSTRASTWLGDAAQLPPVLRGDRADLPALMLPTGGDQKGMVDALAEHAAELKKAQSAEERRLLYVALTRAEQTLLVSGHHWGRTGAAPSGPSEFLTEISVVAAPFAGPAHWAPVPAKGSPNPLTASPRRAVWPVDPLGERRPAIERGADRVLEALAAATAARADRPADPQLHLPLDPQFAPSTNPPTDLDSDPHEWARDVAALLAERSALQNRTVEVALPRSMSVTALVELAADPQALARRIRRPVPSAPSPRGERGSAFHAWVERFYRGSALLEITDLPGANDSGAVTEADIEDLKERFLRSDWATRLPIEIEMPFSTTIAEIPVRGRIDAVFAEPDGGVTVVDWKTGAPPPPARQGAAAVQLAVYRLAAAELLGVPARLVRAAFVHVAQERTVAPVDELDHAGLAALVAEATRQPGPAVGWRHDAGSAPDEPTRAEVTGRGAEVMVR